jgi:formylglycine-generating enzyme required for sulfatase activity
MSVLLLLVSACGEDDVIRPPVDEEPPSPVSDLRVSGSTPTSVTLTWTAPPDNSEAGVEAYDIRYSTFGSAITESAWDALTAIASPPAPSAAGARDTVIAEDLADLTRYHFALRSLDGSGNRSSLSNVVSVDTRSRVEPPPGMAPVRGRSFSMGDGVSQCGASVRPVTLTRSFFIAQHEVTNQEFLDMAQWAYDNGYVTVSAFPHGELIDALDGSSDRLMLLSTHGGTREIGFDGTRFVLVDFGFGINQDHPIWAVERRAAASFCDWKSLQEGLPRAYDHSTWRCNGGDPYGAVGYRLPTDAEWELTAGQGDGRLFPWGNEAPDCDRARFRDCGSWNAPVGSHAGVELIGGYVIYDLAGNIAECVNDWFECDLGAQPSVDPVGPPAAPGRSGTYRGGFWGDSAERLRVGDRFGTENYEPIGQDRLGFRYARSIIP